MENKLFVEMHLLDGDKPAKASANVTIDTNHGELTLKRLKVMESEKGFWVAYPTIDFKGKNDKWVNLRIIVPGSRLKEIISSEVLSQFDVLTAGRSGEK